MISLSICKANYKEEYRAKSVCVSACVRVSVASHISETSEAIAFTFNTVTESYKNASRVNYIDIDLDLLSRSYIS